MASVTAASMADATVKSTNAASAAIAADANTDDWPVISVIRIVIAIIRRVVGWYIYLYPLVANQAVIDVHLTV